MAVLSSDQRRLLERAVVAGRGVAESAAVAMVSRLGVGEESAPGHLSVEERGLRRGLRARARQLGDLLDRAAGGDVRVRCKLLVGQVAYEQWHRLLFARFLEVTGLLRHPEFDAAVTLAECEELAPSLGEPDGWAVAARFAAELVPGIFTESDPCARARLAPEDRLALERVVTGLPGEVFLADDALGWVYQFWQSQAKAEVNASGRKIGGADLAPVTQLFTEDYMVRFLLQNSLGAWWAARHPQSPLVAGWEFLRRDDDGLPAAGSFEQWPETAAEVTVMDPCCGSGHFLVAAFGMLWKMRAEEEDLDVAPAQDAVLRENLFGLELDPRCTQIAMFALALEAWKTGGYRSLPVPQVACSGIPARAPLADWTALADGDDRLEAALGRLHALFADADTLGSLIDPIRATEQAGLESVDWHDIAPLLEKALTAEAVTSGDPAAAVFGEAAAGIARAADYLSRRFTLAATNPPYLTRQKQSAVLRDFFAAEGFLGSADIATIMVERSQRLLRNGGLAAFVTPLGWFSQPAYRDLRDQILTHSTLLLLTRLGPGAFRAITGEIVSPALVLIGRDAPPASHPVALIDAFEAQGAEAKGITIREAELTRYTQESFLRVPGMRIVFSPSTGQALLGEVALSRTGTRTGDNPRLLHFFWEHTGPSWRRLQSVPVQTSPFSGREHVVLWENGSGVLAEFVTTTQASIQGREAWGKRGVCVGLTGELKATLYAGGDL